MRSGEALVSIRFQKVGVLDNCKQFLQTYNLNNKQHRIGILQHNYNEKKKLCKNMLSQGCPNTVVHKMLKDPATRQKG